MRISNAQDEPILKCRVSDVTRELAHVHDGGGGGTYDYEMPNLNICFIRVQITSRKKFVNWEDATQYCAYPTTKPLLGQSIRPQSSWQPCSPGTTGRWRWDIHLHQSSHQHSLLCWAAVLHTGKELVLTRHIPTYLCGQCRCIGFGPSNMFNSERWMRQERKTSLGEK